MLQGKTILLAVTGGIACYKSANLASMLVKEGCKVHVLMTKNATEFITPCTFEYLTKNRVSVDTFDRNYVFQIEHISLSEQADLVLVAPATANILAKLAHGLADDMLTTTILACDCKKIAVPAMNTKMYENLVTQDNIKKLRYYGWEVIEPIDGKLACGVIGKGKMPEPEDLLEVVKHTLSHEKKDMKGLKVLVTAGATREAIDPVRYITNHSTGKMGYAIARAAAARGAEVTLISGKTNLKKHPYMKVINIISAKEMFDEVKKVSDHQDIIIKTAAVSDYSVKNIYEDKIKKDNFKANISLVPTQDILKWLGENKRDGQFLCGFSMETKNLEENSYKKLIDKNLDMIAANNLKDEGAGFEVDTNRLTLITKNYKKQLPLMSKEELAYKLLDEILLNFKKEHQKN